MPKNTLYINTASNYTFMKYIEIKIEVPTADL